MFKTEIKPVPSPSLVPTLPISVTKTDGKAPPETPVVETRVIETTPVWNYYVMGGEFVVIILLIIVLVLVVTRAHF